MNKKKEYIDLANQLIRQILTDENIEKMENCIKRKEVFRVEY
jgi:phosphotransferase system IIB component